LAGERFGEGDPGDTAEGEEVGGGDGAQADDHDRLREEGEVEGEIGAALLVDGGGGAIAVHVVAAGGVGEVDAGEGGETGALDVGVLQSPAGGADEGETTGVFLEAGVLA